MHSLRLAVYESAVLQLSKKEAILSAHSMYKVGKTVFTLQYNCLPEVHSEGQTAKLYKMLKGLNYLMRPTVDETLWCGNGARHFSSYAAVWPVVVLFRIPKIISKYQ